MEEILVSSALLPTAVLDDTDFDPYVWDPDQWLAAELGATEFRELLAELEEAMDAYQGVATPTAEPVQAEAADSLVLALHGLLLQQRVRAPGRAAHLLQCFGGQLYRMNHDRGRLDPLLYWTNLCDKTRGLLEGANADTLGGRLRKAVSAWLSECGIDVIGEADVVQVVYRIAVTHLKRADELLRPISGVK